jgi:hypothetical protein
MDESKREETLAALLEDRQKAERAVMGANMTAGPPIRGVAGSVLSTSYDGVDVDTRHRFATLVTVSPAGAWVTFLESSESDSDRFRRTAKAVFDGLEVVTH